jgi:hypothetical protein
MDIGNFKHKKTGRVIQVGYTYHWAADIFTVEYLGRVFRDSEEPYIGDNWEYIGHTCGHITFLSEHYIPHLIKNRDKKVKQLLKS